MEQSDFNNKLSEYINDCIRHSIFPDISAAQDFEVIVKDKYWLFIPSEPCQFEVNADLYNQIYSTISVVAYPMITMIKTPMQLVSNNSSEFNFKRAFRFPFYHGTVQRLTTNVDNLIDMQTNTKIPIMKNLVWDYHKYSHAIICGMSGSGKSYYLKTLLYQLSHVQGARIILVDPKLSDGARWAKRHDNVDLIIPDFKNAKGIGNAFIEEVNKMLSKVESTMYERQYWLYEHSQTISTTFNRAPVFLVIDELASLSSKDVAKPLINELWAHLTRICLLGRESNVNLIVSLQKPLNTYIDTALREQFSLKMTLGPTTLASLRLLFDNLDSMPFVPNTSQKGVGICSIGGQYIQPVETPTIIESEVTNNA